VKDQILKALRENNDGYLSGEKLAERFRCSRMAIWKHIDELRNRGYRIESVHRKGYRLVADLDPIDPTQWSGPVDTKEIGREVLFFPEIDSTQQMAHQLAREGRPHGTAVLAELQHGGKGRLGRNWFSPAGVGLWTSIILRPNLTLEAAPQITLLIAAAVARTLVMFGYDPKIKWPNDILLAGRKVSGILTELQADLDRVKYIIVGIGLNIHQRLQDFPENIRDKAGSLYIINPEQTPRRELVFKTLCSQIESLYHLYMEHGFLPIKAIWESYSLPMGTRMKITSLKKVFEGTSVGITDQGVLLVKDEAGEIHQIHSADIELNA
jgi:BirA family biotin operon repressor/biotin-[acetyl-CoA-carboxylase] ligase